MRAGLGRGRVVRCAVCSVALLVWLAPLRGQAAVPQATPGLEDWLSSAAAGLTALERASDAELLAGTQVLLRIYLDSFEVIEGWYGPGAPYGEEPLASAVARGEERFHRALQARDVEVLRAAVVALQSDLQRIRETAVQAGVPLVPRQGELARTDGHAVPSEYLTAEIASIARSLEAAASDYAAGRTAAALARVEDVYLQEFEPLEARLPGAVSRDVESLIHLRLRPMIGQQADVADVKAVFAALSLALGRADEVLAGGSGFWFGALNAFVIITREGLEAVLLIAAMLAYLGGMGAARRHQLRIWAGAGLGVAASFATWGLARTLLPVSGASREVLEGATALVAVGVLLYVSHWLFQKTYMHDWKDYLRSKVGQAVTKGSALAMAGLAFAAVYREGFETVLFYQALLYDSSSGAVLAGFAPGMLLILGVGAAILRLGLRLPLKKLFAVTNAILLLLAFTFLGKGIYNLQEAGLFTPHALPWIPDHVALQQALGIYPLVESVLAQGVLLVLLTSAILVFRRRSTRRFAEAVRSAPFPVQAG